MLPLAGPAIAAVAILSFQGTWNDFFWPLILFSTTRHYTLNVGIVAVRLASTRRCGRS